MNKFKRLQITLATVLCLIGGNEVSSSKVNADTPKSAQVSQQAQSKDAKEKTMSTGTKIGFGVTFVVTFVVLFILTSILVKSGRKKEIKFPIEEIAYI